MKKVIIIVAMILIAGKIGVSHVSSHFSYAIPGIATRYLEKEELSEYSNEYLAFAINDVYAHHHRAFEEEKYKEYFEQQKWYKKVEEKSDKEICEEFNRYEKYNIDLIVEYRKHR